MWQPWTGPGLESLRLVEDVGGVRADSVAIGVHEGQPFAIRYAIRCDAAWHVRDVEIASLEGRSTTLALASNGMGRWTDGSGDHVPALRIGVSRQRYRCLTWGPAGGLYRYENAAGDFTADITVDADGLVVEYPQIARRVWTG